MTAEQSFCRFGTRMESVHHPTEEIEEAMFISVSPVQTHVRNVVRKPSARRRQQAARVARRLQLIA
jgi:DNA-binding CsgD family transcriptional regulator